MKVRTVEIYNKEDDEMMTTSELVGWSETVTEGEYLACYEDDGLDEVSDPGSRCGYDDATLDQVRRWLRARDLTIRTDDRGIRVEAAGVEFGTHERCTECGHVQQGQSGQCRECGECSTVTGDEVQS